ncbi:NUDIX domain-containing protein [Methylosarcina fibrata]|uniref:NUDIX domain-containing protein n=1 Tax=Methylosarcina fibrata TaxID=105972 RepID=UPI0003A2ADCA|nr:NUDIX domain-containing protein [Methylosarcina fibrata]
MSFSRSMLQSAGILLFKYADGELQVMLVHPGGPFWSAKDQGAWSIPKGLIDANEEPLAAARREFREETGGEARGNFIELGRLKQPSRKIIHVWAAECDFDVSKIVSNTFVLEWPKNSGRLNEFPEIDRGGWFGLAEARVRMQKGQLGFLDLLEAKLRETRSGRLPDPD